MRVCWECDTETSHTIEVALSSMIGSDQMFPFCADCYERHCMPLVVDLALAFARSRAEKGSRLGVDV